MVRRKMQTIPKSTPKSENSPKPVPTTPVGVIRANELYTLKEFKRRLGFQDATLRRARRDGLRLLREGKRKYVLGRDWIDHLLKIAGHPDGEEGCGHA